MGDTTSIWSLVTAGQLVASAATVVASFLGAWLAARFALSRFYSEKLWERKTAAYTAIFEALHDMRRWFDEHLEAEIKGIQLTKDAQKALSKEYQLAKRNLERRLASETWLIPDECRSRLLEMMMALDYNGDRWVELLETGTEAISTAEVDLRKQVRRDLNLEATFWQGVRASLSWVVSPFRKL